MTIKKLIGSDPNQISLNRDLGSMAFQDYNGFSVSNNTLGLFGYGKKFYENVFTFNNSAGNKTLSLTGLTMADFGMGFPTTLIIHHGMVGLTDAGSWCQMLVNYRGDYVGSGFSVTSQGSFRYASTAGQSFTFGLTSVASGNSTTVPSLALTASGPDVGAGGYTNMVKVVGYYSNTTTVP
jgi:hypothetical protein